MEATCSSETLVNFQLNTRRYMPEDTTLHKIQSVIKADWQEKLQNKFATLSPLKIFHFFFLFLVI
jgi:hypothetical protein